MAAADVCVAKGGSFVLSSPPSRRLFPVHAREARLSSNMLTVGTEWLIEASGCDADALCDIAVLRAVFERAIRELDLRVVGEPLWHKFAGEGGVTGLAMLTESHLACHTYPEFGVATFNLYCCRERPVWAWEERLAEMLGASAVSVRSVSRAVSNDSTSAPLPPTLDSSNAAPHARQESSVHDSLRSLSSISLREGEA